MGEQLYQHHEVESIAKLTAAVIVASDPARSLAFGLRLALSATDVAVYTVKIRNGSVRSIQTLSGSPTAVELDLLPTLNSLLCIQSPPLVRFLSHRILLSVGERVETNATVIAVRGLPDISLAKTVTTLKIVHGTVDRHLAKTVRFTALGTPRRELDVLAGIIRGGTDKEIGAQLGISHHTVHSHVRSLFKRYSVSSRSQLVVRTLRVSDGIPFQN